MWFESHQEKPISQIRLEELLATDPKMIATACPFCLNMLTSAVQSNGLTDKINVRDIAIFVAEALK
jgi:Fe-S oxidoreductase